jgi:FKBP-type peptidyl-prolyl cis-trans isomerase FklB
MKMTPRLILAVGLALSLSQSLRAADEKSDFKDDKEKASYAIGMYFGNQIKRGNMEVDADAVNSAMRDVLDGKTLKMTDQQAGEAIRNYQQAELKRVSEKNKKEGEAFLEANKKKPGVKVQEVKLPDGSSAELQYKVITEGKGETPKTNDVVQVNYKGTLINGKEFDSSSKHNPPGQPSKMGLNRVIRGWTEALEMMKTGSKWEIYLPSSLAYGDRGYPPDIAPGATLIFEMELVAIEPPPPPPPPAQPLTSDIIKVPSAEELKKGAKIEVLKPEDVEKAKKEAEEKARKDGTKPSPQ